MCCRVTEVGPGSPGKEVEESAGPVRSLVVALRWFLKLAAQYGNLKVRSRHSGFERESSAFAQCDAPPRLHASMLDAINEYASDASMMIFTGDIVDRASLSYLACSQPRLTSHRCCLVVE